MRSQAALMAMIASTVEITMILEAPAGRLLALERRLTPRRQRPEIPELVDRVGSWLSSGTRISRRRSPGPATMCEGRIVFLVA